MPRLALGLQLSSQPLAQWSCLRCIWHNLDFAARTCPCDVNTLVSVPLCWSRLPNFHSSRIQDTLLSACSWRCRSTMQTHHRNGCTAAITLCSSSQRLHALALNSYRGVSLSTRPQAYLVCISNLDVMQGRSVVFRRSRFGPFYRKSRPSTSIGRPYLAVSCFCKLLMQLHVRSFNSSGTASSIAHYVKRGLTTCTGPAATVRICHCHQWLPCLSSSP